MLKSFTGAGLDGPELSRSERRFLEAIARLSDHFESKQNFDPNQPRRPKGVPIGGQWTVSPSTVGTVSPSNVRRAVKQGAARLEVFLIKHRRELTRILGGIQALSGGAEFIGGASLGVVGIGTSEVGVGIPISLLAGWMVANGFDNAQAGWRALVTGDPQETSLYQALRGIGLGDKSASAVEVFLSGGVGLAGAKVSRAALNRTAYAALERRAALPFDLGRALHVQSNGRSLWAEFDIRVRGEAWERFDVGRTGFRWYPNGKVFDQISSDEMIAVSNKSLDLMRETYLRTDRRALYQTLKKYVDQAADYTPISPETHSPMAIRRREIHLLLRFGDALPAQALQIAAAEEYAIARGVHLKVEYAH